MKYPWYRYGHYTSKRQAQNIAANLRAHGPRHSKVRVRKTQKGATIYTWGM